MSTRGRVGGIFCRQRRSGIGRNAKSGRGLEMSACRGGRKRLADPPNGAFDPIRTYGTETRGECDLRKRAAQFATSNLEGIETLLKHDSSVGDIKPKSNGRMVNPNLKGRRRANDSLSEPRLHRRAACRYRRVCSASGQVRSRHRLEMQPDAGRDQLCARGRSVMLSDAPVTMPECRPMQDPAPRCPACNALVRLAHCILDTREGRTVRLYECECGRRVWED